MEKVLILLVIGSTLGKLLCAGVQGQNVDFTYYPGVSDKDYVGVAGICTADSCTNATDSQAWNVSMERLQLLPMTGNRDAAASMRYMREKPVQFFNTTSNIVVSFELFLVAKVTPPRGGVPGDGFTFLIAPEIRPPVNSMGAGMGAFTYGKVNKAGAPVFERNSKILALAFDTNRNEDLNEDLMAPFLALVYENVTTSCGQTPLGSDTFGTTFALWMDYSPMANSLDVTMLYLPDDLPFFNRETARELKGKAERILRCSNFVLRDWINGSSFVGFSAGKGSNDVENNEIFYMQLQTKGLPFSESSSPDLPDPASSSHLNRSGNEPPAVTIHRNGGGWRRKLETVDRNSSKAIIIGVSIAGVSVFILSILVIVILLWRRAYGRSRNRQTLESKLVDIYGLDAPRVFEYAELQQATNNFSKEALLGEGGCGKVYKGILQDLTAVAVKRIQQYSERGEKEFRAEVTIISSLRHRNIVRLRGYCQKGTEELLLVYDFVPHGSLDKYYARGNLDNIPQRRDRGASTSENADIEKNIMPTFLTWDQRLKIIQGVAAALLYLHEDWGQSQRQRIETTWTGRGKAPSLRHRPVVSQAVLHRDIKPSNVLLDTEMNAQLADFGLARLLKRDAQFSETTANVAGTWGYIPPESTNMRVSTSGDVYSFGVLVLAVCSGRAAIDYLVPEEEQVLLKWVKRLQREDRLLEAADQRLECNFDSEQMLLVLSVGLICAAPDPKKRPSIRQVVQTLANKDMSSLVPGNGHTDHCGGTAPFLERVSLKSNW